EPPISRAMPRDCARICQASPQCGDASGVSSRGWTTRRASASGRAGARRSRARSVEIDHRPLRSRTGSFPFGNAQRPWPQPPRGRLSRRLYPASVAAWGTAAPIRGTTRRGRATAFTRPQVFLNAYWRLQRPFRQGGPAAIAKVRKYQPAAYMKICALMIPKEMKLEHSGSVIKAMTDEELDAALEALRDLLARREAAAN